MISNNNKELHYIILGSSFIPFISQVKSTSAFEDDPIDEE